MRYASIRIQDFTRFFILFCFTILLLWSVHHDVFAQNTPVKTPILDLNQSENPTYFIQTFRCTMKTKTVVFYVDTKVKAPSLFNKGFQKLCDFIGATSLKTTEFDFDSDGIVEVRVTNLNINSATSMNVVGKVELDNVIKAPQGQRDIIYLNENLFGNPSLEKISTIFLHENQHLRQFHQYYCTTMKQCNTNRSKNAPSYPDREVRALLEGDAVRESCLYEFSVCSNDSSIPPSTKNSVIMKLNCFNALDYFGYSCAYKLVQKINEDFNTHRKDTYKNMNINPIIEALRKKDALKSLSLFKSALNEVFKKYTTITSYDLYKVEEGVREKPKNFRPSGSPPRIPSSFLRPPTRK
jgi:hypothetical protein